MDRRHARSLLRQLARRTARDQAKGPQAVRLAARSLAVGGTRWDRSAYNAVHPCRSIPCVCPDPDQEG